MNARATIRETRRRRVALLGVALSISLSSGCEPATPSPAPIPRTTARPTADPILPKSGVFPSKRFGVRLPLPDGKAWKIDDRSSHWLDAKHPGEGSSLLLRTWRDENRMTRDKCQATARLLRKLPTLDGAEVLDTRRIDQPPGFDTELEVASLPDQKGGLFGVVLAFGGLGRRCFAFVYVTQASGRDADRVVGARLATIVEESLLGLRFESDLDATLERDLNGN